MSSLLSHFHRRKPSLTPAPSAPTPSALTAATQAYHPSPTHPPPSLSASAAAAALSLHPSTASTSHPIDSDIKRRRLRRRSSQTSTHSQASSAHDPVRPKSAGVGSVPSRNSSLSQRTFRKHPPGPPPARGLDAAQEENALKAAVLAAGEMGRARSAPPRELSSGPGRGRGRHQPMGTWVENEPSVPARASSVRNPPPEVPEVIRKASPAGLREQSRSRSRGRASLDLLRSAGGAGGYSSSLENVRSFDGPNGSTGSFKSGGEKRAIGTSALRKAENASVGEEEWRGRPTLWAPETAVGGEGGLWSARNGVANAKTQQGHVVSAVGNAPPTTRERRSVSLKRDTKPETTNDAKTSTHNGVKSRQRQQSPAKASKGKQKMDPTTSEASATQEDAQHKAARLSFQHSQPQAHPAEQTTSQSPALHAATTASERSAPKLPVQPPTLAQPKLNTAAAARAAQTSARHAEGRGGSFILTASTTEMASPAKKSRESSTARTETSAQGSGRDPLPPVVHSISPPPSDTSSDDEEYYPHRRHEIRKSIEIPRGIPSATADRIEHAFHPGREHPQVLPLSKEETVVVQPASMEDFERARSPSVSSMVTATSSMYELPGDFPESGKASRTRSRSSSVDTITQPTATHPHEAHENTIGLALSSTPPTTNGSPPPLAKVANWREVVAEEVRKMGGTVDDDASSISSVSVYEDAMESFEDAVESQEEDEVPVGPNTLVLPNITEIISEHAHAHFAQRRDSEASSSSGDTIPAPSTPKIHRPPTPPPAPATRTPRPANLTTRFEDPPVDSLTKKKSPQISNSPPPTPVRHEPPKLGSLVKPKPILKNAREGTAVDYSSASERDAPFISRPGMGKGDSGEESSSGLSESSFQAERRKRRSKQSGSDGVMFRARDGGLTMRATHGSAPARTSSINHGTSHPARKHAHKRHASTGDAVPPPSSSEQTARSETSLSIHSTASMPVASSTAPLGPGLVRTNSGRLQKRNKSLRSSMRENPPEMRVPPRAMNVQDLMGQGAPLGGSSRLKKAETTPTATPAPAPVPVQEVQEQQQQPPHTSLEPIPQKKRKGGFFGLFRSKDKETRRAEKAAAKTQREEEERERKKRNRLSTVSTATTATAKSTRTSETARPGTAHSNAALPEAPEALKSTDSGTEIRKASTELGMDARVDGLEALRNGGGIVFAPSPPVSRQDSYEPENPTGLEEVREEDEEERVATPVSTPAPSTATPVSQPAGPEPAAISTSETSTPTAHTPTPTPTPAIRPASDSRPIRPTSPLKKKKSRFSLLPSFHKSSKPARVRKQESESSVRRDLNLEREAGEREKVRRKLSKKGQGDGRSIKSVKTEGSRPGTRGEEGGFNAGPSSATTTPVEATTNGESKEGASEQLKYSDLDGSHATYATEVTPNTADTTSTAPSTTVTAALLCPTHLNAPKTQDHAQNVTTIPVPPSPGLAPPSIESSSKPSSLATGGTGGTGKSGRFRFWRRKNA